MSGTIGFAPQQAWIQNAIVKENILFGQPYDHQRYLRAIHTCALERDLELFPDGDSTEIGERGINLSGGQKQR
jgi:ABC-type multidrug transport system fused ATPase/permease subunit